MKTVTCDLCDHTETATTFEEWLEKLKPHYQTAHADFMQEMMKKSKEEQMANYQDWMKVNKDRFNAS